MEEAHARQRNPSSVDETETANLLDRPRRKTVFGKLSPLSTMPTKIAEEAYVTD